MPRMHADQADTSEDLVRRLVAEQFPAWAGLPVRAVTSSGTDHDVYRLGDDLAARLPRVPDVQGQADVEARWLAVMAPRLPVPIPEQLAAGEPGAGYPFRWSVVRWLPGTDASRGRGDDERMAADLAAFVRALQRIPTSGAHPRRAGGRGAPLAELHTDVVRSVEELGSRVDGAAALRSWHASLDAQAWPGPDVWVHGDLLPGNLVVAGGRLTGVIDFGTLNVGDPAVELLAAWNVFSGGARLRYREELGVDDASWLRGRGWALSQALIALPYYWETNPGMVAQASHALREVLAR